jgi:hypothetical protein
MPMQIIQENRKPTTAERFNQAFGKAAQTAGQFGNAIGQKKQRQEQEKQQQIQMQQENEAARRMGIDLEGLSPENRKKFFESAIAHQQDLEKQKQKYGFEEDLQNQKYGLEGDLKDKADKLKGPSKEETASKETQEVGQKAFNGMVKLLKRGNLGRGSGVMSLLGGKTAKESGEFTSLSGGLEAMLVDKVSRGTLSNTRFDYIKNNLLPVSTDSDAVIEGKLTGLAEILGLDASELTGNKASGKGNKPPLTSFLR